MVFRKTQRNLFWHIYALITQSYYIHNPYKHPYTFNIPYILFPFSPWTTISHSTVNNSPINKNSKHILKTGHHTPACTASGSFEHLMPCLSNLIENAFYSTLSARSETCVKLLRTAFPCARRAFIFILRAVQSVCLHYLVDAIRDGENGHPLLPRAAQPSILCVCVNVCECVCACFHLMRRRFVSLDCEFVVCSVFRIWQRSSCRRCKSIQSKVKSLEGRRRGIDESHGWGSWLRYVNSIASRSTIKYMLAAHSLI